MIKPCSLSWQREIDRTCDAFEQACRTDEPPRVEEYLLRVPNELRPVLLIELLKVQVELQRAAGQLPDWSDYAVRFPEYAAEVRQLDRWRQADPKRCDTDRDLAKPWMVHTQVRELCQMPDNVEVQFAKVDNGSLYEQGDVCVQPSRWEGLGLSLLECQAAGMPLVTTDAAPMNEYRPLRAVPAREQEWVSVYMNQPILSHNMDPGELAATLMDLYRTDIAAASRAARKHIEEYHNWETAVRILRERMRC